jgi:hypothetical protein
VNPFINVSHEPPDTQRQGVRGTPEERAGIMTVRTVDQIRLLITIAAIISVAVAVGIAPTMWAAL